MIHIEQSWVENIYTAEGRVMHENVHDEHAVMSGDIRIEYGIPLCSFELGLSGKADVVEFHRTADGGWLPFPVEYKRGRPKGDDCDRIQLCAQALCLEEMMGVKITEGALYYGKTRRRQSVEFDDALRDKTREIAGQTHRLINGGITPAPVYSEKCKSCSFYDQCLPLIITKKSKVGKYLQRELFGQ